MEVQKLFLFKTAWYAIVVLPYNKQFGKISRAWHFLFIKTTNSNVLEKSNIVRQWLISVNLDGSKQIHQCIMS